MIIKVLINYLVTQGRMPAKWWPLYISGYLTISFLYTPDLIEITCDVMPVPESVVEHFDLCNRLLKRLHLYYI